MIMNKSMKEIPYMALTSEPALTEPTEPQSMLSFMHMQSLITPQLQSYISILEFHTGTMHYACCTVCSASFAAP